MSDPSTSEVLGKTMMRWLMSIGCYLHIVGSIVTAQVVLQPSELLPGTEYRLVFTTSQKVAATMQNNSFYDGFVQSVVDDSPVGRWALEWTAMISNGSEDARDRTGTNPFDSLGVPIYRIDGELFSPDNRFWVVDGVDFPDVDFLSGDLIPLTVSELGEPVPDPMGELGPIGAWTRTNGDGTYHAGVGAVRSTTVFGWADDFRGLLWFADVTSPDTELHVYAISDVLVAVPESHAGAGIVVGLVAFALRRSRRTFG